jgi:hypothetical protein
MSRRSTDILERFDGKEGTGVNRSTCVQMHGIAAPALDDVRTGEKAPRL